MPSPCSWAKAVPDSSAAKYAAARKVRIVTPQATSSLTSGFIFVLQRELHFLRGVLLARDFHVGHDEEVQRRAGLRRLKHQVAADTECHAILGQVAEVILGHG